MIYLASGSPRRKVLLRKARIRFTVLRPSYAEVHRDSGSAVALTKKHALGKALSVVPQVKNGIILGADTVVVHEGRILGKPRNMKAAEKMLDSLLGRRHFVVTAVALLRMQSGRIQKKSVFIVKTAVSLRKLERSELLAYLKRIGPLDKAGGYAAQASGPGIIHHVKGSFSNVVGLPIEKLKIKLRMLI